MVLEQLKDDTEQLLKTEQAALDDSIRRSSLVVILGDLVLTVISAAGEGAQVAEITPGRTADAVVDAACSVLSSCRCRP